MKLKVGNAVYLQKNDVAFIMHDLCCVPAFFVDEIFTPGEPFIMMDLAEDGMEFCCRLEKIESVKWVMNQDWILDYHEFKDLPIGTLKAMRMQIRQELDEKIDIFNAQDDDYRSKNFNRKAALFSQMEHKIFSLKIMEDYLRAKISFVFPDELAKSMAVPQKRKKKTWFGRFFRQ